MQAAGASNLSRTVKQRPNSGVFCWRGFPMLATIDAQLCIAKGIIGEGAMVRTRRTGMGMGPEMAAGQAHLLQWDRACLLKISDNVDQAFQQTALIQFRQSADCRH